MAGDWIKMSTGLRTHPKIVRIARASKADKLRVVGALHAVWCIFDEHSEDGYLDGYTLASIDEETFKGFAKALISVGWLEEEPDGMRVPRFDTHNGASAKRRAQEAERKRTDRGQKSDAGRTADGQTSAADADKKRTREEKRREEEELSGGGEQTQLEDREADEPVAPLSKSVQERALDLAVLCRKAGAPVNGTNPYVLEWAKRGISDAQALTAVERAIEARHRKGDPSPVNAGFLDKLLGDVVDENPSRDFDRLADAAGYTA